MLLQVVISGISVGCVYALVAVGFVLIFDAVGAINFAQGDLLTLGAFLGVGAGRLFKVPVYGVYVMALLGMVVFGWVFQRFVIFPVRNRSLLTVIVATLGLGLIIENGSQVVFGSSPLPLVSPVPALPIRFRGVGIYPQELFIIGTAAVSLLLLHLLLARTYIGVRLRATAQDLEIARLVGVRVRRTILLTFVLSSVLSGLAGLLLGGLQGVSADMGSQAGLEAFVAAVIGGFGNLTGAVISALLLGLAESFIGTYISPSWTDAIAFIALMAFLMFRPQGIFGEVFGEKV